MNVKDYLPKFPFKNYIVLLYDSIESEPIVLNLSYEKLQLYYPNWEVYKCIRLNRFNALIGVLSPVTDSEIIYKLVETDD